ncbi:MAG TPA: hypothetical protein VK708_04785 [Bryobacteraceae bacterium]|jgi:hypothetical protein|nr:hypothetical protein [Bryobacteraceae bacterium]
MRSLLFTLTLIPLLLLGAGCKRRHKSSETQLPVSTIFAGDPNVADHFAKGFYSVEAGAWRWTAKEFAVDLSAPLNSDQKGAQLVVKLAVPDAVIQKSGSVQLSASIDNYKLPPETYSKSGSYTYTRDVPADKLPGGTVQINFAVDHTLPPTGSDIRELGIIVSDVGLVAK